MSKSGPPFTDPPRYIFSLFHSEILVEKGSTFRHLDKGLVHTSSQNSHHLPHPRTPSGCCTLPLIISPDFCAHLGSFTPWDHSHLERFPPSPFPSLSNLSREGTDETRPSEVRILMLRAFIFRGALNTFKKPNRKKPNSLPAPCPEHMIRPQTTSVLSEVPPSPSNVSKPHETESEHWVAVAGGLFEACDEGYAFEVWNRSHKQAKPKAIAKKSLRTHWRKAFDHYENHCRHTQCTFPFGHNGQHSYMIVTGKRGGRV